MKKLWIGTDEDPDKRLVVEISDEDARMVNKHLYREDTGRVIVEVIELVTEKKYRIRSADCGLSCRCAVELAT